MRRLLWSVLVVVILVTITFVIFFVMPPNDSPWQSFTHGGARTGQASEFTKEALGLDQPVYVQYGLFVKHLFLGDQYGWPGMWFSFQTRSPLKPIIASRAVVTAQLAIGAALVWLIIGIPLAVVS